MCPHAFRTDNTGRHILLYTYPRDPPSPDDDSDYCLASSSYTIDYRQLEYQLLALLCNVRPTFAKARPSPLRFV